MTHVHLCFDKLNNLVKKCALHFKFLNEILAQSITLGIFKHNFGCRLLDAYAKIDKVVEARKIFDLMPSPDVSSWNSLQNVYLKNKQPLKTLTIFSELISRDLIRPDSHSMVAALSACARIRDIRNGRAIHAMVFTYLENPRPSVHNALIDMYGKTGRVDLARRVFGSLEFKDLVIWTSLLNGCILNGDVEYANKVFDEMPQRNVVSWTAMISGYVRRRNPMEAFELFVRMRREDGESNPNAYTVVALLSACADIGALNLGSSIHGYVNKRVGFVSDIVVNNGLLDMYAKGGNLDSAQKIFNSMGSKDLFSWTCMISSLGVNGRGEDALLLFESMVESGLIPNEVTFLSVLSACSHSGLVSEGERFFTRFVDGYHLKPRIQHFGCMVDLFVRAGHLEKAIEMIGRMPMQPDAVIWRALVVACISHGNLQLAEICGKEALRLDPTNDSVYVLLWSMYCSKSRWNEASAALKSMKDERVKKMPGCSWIEVNGVVHEFLAAASQHYVCGSILLLLHLHSKLQDTNDYFECTSDL